MIYHCFGGSHSSVTCAGIHLGILPRDRIPVASEFMQVPHFDCYEKITHGHFRFIGCTLGGEQIYVLGKRTLGPRITHLLSRVAAVFEASDRIYPVDTSRLINLVMIIGGFLSRAIGLVTIGRPIAIFGTQLAYTKYLRLVGGVEENILPRDQDGKQQPVRRRVVFYLCGSREDSLTAAFHIFPGADHKEASKWVRQLSFTGSIGEVYLAGRADGCHIYLVGARGGIEIVGRMLRELRILLEVPLESWFVVEVVPAYPFRRRLLICWQTMRGCAGQAEQRNEIIRREVERIRRTIIEGILD